MRNSLVWAVGVSLTALTFAPNAAFAQAAKDAAADTTADNPDTNTIVVTAQGRAQQLEVVPVAISAVKLCRIRFIGRKGK